MAKIKVMGMTLSSWTTTIELQEHTNIYRYLEGDSWGSIGWAVTYNLNNYCYYYPMFLGKLYDIRAIYYSIYPKTMINKYEYKEPITFRLDQIYEAQKFMDDFLEKIDKIKLFL